MNKDSIALLPAARKDELIVKELDGEVLVYDLQRDKAHCLNSTAGLVWKHCNGRNSVSEIANFVGDETKTFVDERIVRLALDELEKFHLLEDAPAKPAHWAGMNRRQLIRNVGFAALAMPVILSIAAPTVQAASSCAPSNGACGANGQCLQWFRCGSPGAPALCPPGNNHCL